MNSYLLRKAFRQQYRKRALRISVGVHVLFLIIFTVFFLKSQVTEIEDEIQMDIISELPRQNMVKKKALPIPKKETPIPREQTVVKPKQSVEIAKMSAAPKRINIDEQTPEKIDIDAPALLEMPDLSTDVDLTLTPESMLSPIPSDTGDTPGKSYGRRTGTGARAPGKGTSAGIGKHVKGTGTADGLGKIGADVDVGATGSSLFGDTLKNLAKEIIQSSGGAPIDVVFVVDTSGSMHDKIRAVADHISQMIDVYEASKSNYALGLTLFTTFRTGGNDIKVHPLTVNSNEIKKLLYACKAEGAENLLDAIHQTVMEMEFRTNTVKHFIVVTDDVFSSIQGFTVEDTVALCLKNQIYVNVLGVPSPGHIQLAADTGGTWHVIPEDLQPQTVR